MLTINELKSCPFCGCGAALVEDEGAYKVFCLGAHCDAQYGWCAAEEQAVEGWNRRKRSEPRWIPVNERLPEEEERVLATHLGGVNPNNQVIEHIYQCGNFTCGWDIDMNVDSPTFGQRYMGRIIAWMPLPNPYQPETERETDDI